MVLLEASHHAGVVGVAGIAVPVSVLLGLMVLGEFRRLRTARRADISIDASQPGAMEPCASLSRSAGANCAWRGTDAPNPGTVETNLMPESAVQANSGASASQLLIAIAVSGVLFGLVVIALYLPLFNIPKVLGR